MVRYEGARVCLSVCGLAYATDADSRSCLWAYDISDLIPAVSGTCVDGCGYLSLPEDFGGGVALYLLRELMSLV